MKRLNSYKYNVLLVKDDVGVSKPSTRRLPSWNFTFGKAERRDLEGAEKGKFLILPSTFASYRQTCFSDVHLAILS